MQFPPLQATQNPASHLQFPFLPAHFFLLGPVLGSPLCLHPPQVLALWFFGATLGFPHITSFLLGAPRNNCLAAASAPCAGGGEVVVGGGEVEEKTSAAEKRLIRLKLTMMSIIEESLLT